LTGAALAADTLVAGDIATSAVTTDEILNGTIADADTNGALTTAALAATLAFANADLVDFSAVSVTDATEGIFLPQHATTCAAATAEGQVCWEADDNLLWIGDSVAAVSVGNPFGASIDSAEITDGVIADADTNGVLTGAALAADTLVAGDIATSAVATAEILNATIIAEDFATGAVDTTAILNGTVAKADMATAFITVGNLADDESGWAPDGALLTWTITPAVATAIGANSAIFVSLGAGDVAGGACTVTDRVAATSFTVRCGGAIPNAATLQYVIMN
jgi:hypothetical protein